MYLCIDVGGTKTLIANVDDQGIIIDQIKFPTPQKFIEFIPDLKEALQKLTDYDYLAIGIGVPATKLNRQVGAIVESAHLPLWRHSPLKEVLESNFHLPVAIENDAKLAALSESMLRKHFSRLLYVTVSTGIGYGLVVDNKIDQNIGDGGGSLIILEHHGKYLPWEDFAAGSAIVKIYDQRAEEITDPKIWEQIAKNLALGLIELIAVTEPDVIVLGGSVGAFLDNYKQPLIEYMSKYQTPLNKIPPIETAKRPNEAVVYGAYDLAKSLYPFKS